MKVSKIYRLHSEVFDHQPNIGDGWGDLLLRFVEELKIQDPEGRILQVKEKFGGLRIYFLSNRFLQLRDLADRLEEQSLKTCEECGKEGKATSRSSGWVKTLCVECREAEI